MNKFYNVFFTTEKKNCSLNESKDFIVSFSYSMPIKFAALLYS